MSNAKYVVRGQYNDILTEDIGEGTIISGWTFIGKGVKIGKNCRIGNHVNIDSFAVLGDNVNLQTGVYIPSNTVIGDNAFFAAHTAIADEKYPTVGQQVRRTVTIGRNTVIGIGAKIIAVDIGDYAVVGAMSKVMHPVPENQVWNGNPAKMIGTRAEYEDKKAKWEAEQLAKAIT